MMVGGASVAPRWTVNRESGEAVINQFQEIQGCDLQHVNEETGLRSQ